MADPCAICRDLVVAYDDGHLALQGTSLELPRGRATALLGANGCGKTTLLRTLVGLLKPRSGSIEVYLGGERLVPAGADLAKLRRRTGLLFQHPDDQILAPTVADDVALGPLCAELPSEEVERRVDAALEAVGLWALRERHPGRLSYGERRRVALAGLLALEPELLLLDEPTSSLDPAHAGALIDILAAQRDAGRTLFMATHDLHLVDALADHVIVLDEQGRVVAADLPERILHDQELLRSQRLLHRHGHVHGIHHHGHGHGQGP